MKLLHGNSLDSMRIIYKAAIAFIFIATSVASVASDDVLVRSYIDAGTHSQGGVSLMQGGEDVVYSLSSFDNSIRAWSLSSRSLIGAAFLDARDGVAAIGFCKHQGQVLVFQRRGESSTRIYRMSEDELKEVGYAEINTRLDKVNCSSSRDFAIGYSGKKVTIVDLNSPSVPSQFSVSFKIASISIHPTLQRFVILGFGGELEQFTLDDKNWSSSSRASASFIGAMSAQVAYSPSGRLLAVSSYGLGAKLFADIGLQARGSWESIAAGIRSTNSLNVLVWRSDREIVFGGDADPVLRYVNNRGELTKASSYFEIPISDISDMLSVNGMIVSGRINGKVQVMAGSGELGKDFSTKNKAPKFKTISFYGGNDYRFSVMADTDLFNKELLSSRNVSEAETINIALHKREHESHFILIQDGTVREGVKSSLDTNECAGLIKFETGDGYIDGHHTPGGPFIKVSDSKLEIKFIGWPESPSPSWGSCVDSSGEYVAFASSDGVSLYKGSEKKIWSLKTNSPAWDVAISPNRLFVAVLCADGSIEWRRFSTGELQWTTIPLHKGWIVVLPTGHFVGSEGGFKSMMFRLDNQHGKSWRIDGETFFDVFYRPDIVAASIRGEDISNLIGDLTIEKAIQNPPPKVELGDTPIQTSAQRIRVPYTITPDAGGIAEVRVFQNGKLISSDGTYKDALGKIVGDKGATSAYVPVGSKSADAARYAEEHRNATRLELVNTPAANQAGSLRNQLIVRGAPEKKCAPGQPKDPCKGEIEVDVIPGEENTITVIAFNRDNTIQSVPASVSFKSTQPKEDPHLWVVGVGINQFASINALKNARKDAQDFVCVYAGKDGVSKLGMACNENGKAKTLFKPQNIHVVDNLFDTKATKTSILGALDKVAKQAKPGDTFVWFVASHGMMDANSLFGIIAHDTQCLNSNCTDLKGHITSNEILEASKKIKAMKQLVVLDTCHSGGLDSKLSGLYDARVSLLAKNMGLHLYASAQATEAALDGAPGTNGAFTAQLLEGIKGAASKNSEGQISVMTLGQYARQKTIEATQPRGGAKDARPAQTPVIQHFGQDAGLVAVK